MSAYYFKKEDEDKNDREFMESEFDTLPSLTESTESVSDKAPITNYTEYIKPAPKRKGVFAKYVAALVVCALVASPMFGAAAGFGSKMADYLFGGVTYETNSETVSSNPEEFVKIDGGLTKTVSVSEGKSIPDIFKATSASVVNITTSTFTRNDFYSFYFGNANREQRGAGTGIVFKEDDTNVYIMTNFHVAENADDIYVSFQDLEQIDAVRVGADKANDIAIISVKKADLQAEGITSVQVAAIGDSDKMEVGDSVIAIGNALGFGKTATFGIVSALNKSIGGGSYSARRGGMSVDTDEQMNYIQTDAAINPGNSGGALVNMNGEVIGMNTAKLATEVIEGMGFAIPSNTFVPVVNKIMGEKNTERPFIGISGGSIDKSIAERYGFITETGVIVDAITSNSGADDAGIRGGDIITHFNGKKVNTVEELQNQVALCKVGDKVPVKLVRNRDKEIELTVEVKDMSVIAPW